MNRMTRIAIFIGTAALVAANRVPAEATPRAVVRLECVPGSVLPGIPPNLVISVSNPGDRMIEIVNTARLHVTAPSGDTFVATADESSSPVEWFSLLPPPAPKNIVATGQAKQFAAQVGPLLSEPEFFWDERFSTPGRYLLRLELMVGSTPPFDAVQSNEASLMVVEPEDQDALVWERMTELSEGRGWSGFYWDAFGRELAKFIAGNAPNSGYFPYVAHLKWGQTDAELREGIQRALALRPQGPVADLLRGYLGGWYHDRGEEALSAGDLERALELHAEARVRAMETNASTPYFWLRENGERWLAEDAETESTLRARFAANVRAMSSYSEPIAPFVECVDPAASPSDPYIVRFGYLNPNRGAKFVERGKHNDLTPSAAKVQPRVFQPGRQSHGFSFTTHAERVTWTVDGKTATASRETQPRCSWPDLRAVGIRPVVECVERDGRNVMITFGYENPAAVAVRIAGEANRLAGSTSRPPEIFEPGRHHGVMRVKASDGETVSWTVAGRTASASPPPSGCATSPR